MTDKIIILSKKLQKALVLGVLSSLAFLFVPVASADVLEFNNGKVKSHIAVDYRNRPAKVDSGTTLQSIVVTQWVQPPAWIANLIELTAKQHDLDPLLLTAIMAQESNFNPQAVSSKGAMGLMQLMPETAAQLGVLDAFDPSQNIEAGARYFKSLLRRYNGDHALALAAYNAGTRAVDSYGGVPPYSETRDYIIRINDRYNATKPKPIVVEPPKPAPSQIIYGGGQHVVDTFTTENVAPLVHEDQGSDETKTPVEPESKVEPIKAELPTAQSAIKDEPQAIEIEWYIDRVPDFAKTIVNNTE